MPRSYATEWSGTTWQKSGRLRVAVGSGTELGTRRKFCVSSSNLERDLLHLLIIHKWLLEVWFLDEWFWNRFRCSDLTSTWLVFVCLVSARVSWKKYKHSNIRKIWIFEYFIHYLCFRFCTKTHFYPTYEIRVKKWRFSAIFPLHSWTRYKSRLTGNYAGCEKLALFLFSPDVKNPKRII